MSACAATARKHCTPRSVIETGETINRFDRVESWRQSRAEAAIDLCLIEAFVESEAGASCSGIGCGISPRPRHY